MIISKVFVFGNGMISAFNEANEQILEFQGFLFDVDFKEMAMFMDKDTSLFINGVNETDIFWWLQKHHLGGC